MFYIIGRDPKEKKPETTMTKQEGEIDRNKAAKKWGTPKQIKSSLFGIFVETRKKLMKSNS